jgi:hypothetical protein
MGHLDTALLHTWVSKPLAPLSRLQWRSAGWLSRPKQDVQYGHLTHLVIDLHERSDRALVSDAAVSKTNGYGLAMQNNTTPPTSTRLQSCMFCTKTQSLADLSKICILSHANPYDGMFLNPMLAVGLGVRMPLWLKPRGRLAPACAQNFAYPEHQVYSIFL